jgi:hypothetical protein
MEKSETGRGRDGEPPEFECGRTDQESTGSTWKNVGKGSKPGEFGGNASKCRQDNEKVLACFA